MGLTSGFIKKLLRGIPLDGFDIPSDSVHNVDHTLSDQAVFTCDFDDLAYDYRLIVVANVLHHVLVDERRSMVRTLANRMLDAARLAIFEHNPAIRSHAGLRRIVHLTLTRFCYVPVKSGPTYSMRGFVCCVAILSFSYHISFLRCVPWNHF